MKFGQLIEYKKGFFFLWKNYAENRAEKLARDFFFVFKNFLYELKAFDQHISFNIFWQFFTWTYKRGNCIALQIVDPEICSTLIF